MKGKFEGDEYPLNLRLAQDGYPAQPGIYPEGSTFKSPDNNGEVVSVRQNNVLNSESDSLEHLIIKIAPNPTKSTINILTSGVANQGLNWTLTDLNGRQLKSGKTNQPTFTIDLTVYERGMYYLRIGNKNEIQTFKVIKQ
ncbi:MAG: T9SS type A sorting domain-containing protein [Crocinitomicaceae bacterium]